MITLGLDIGGTKTAALVVGPDTTPGEGLAATDVASPEGVVRSAAAAAAEALAAAGLDLSAVAAAGAGVPGLVDPASGTVRLAVNLNFHAPFPLARALEDALGVPVALENDVRTAALGAYQWLQQTAPVRSLAYLSIGTGIAAGIVIDGRLYRGVNGMAGEIGHIPVDPAGTRCACGSFGCLETVASGPAIAAYAREVLAEANGGQDWTTAEVFSLAADGNQGARHVTSRAAHYLSRAIYLLVMTYDVEKVVLGGGVTHAGDGFWQPIDKALHDLRRDSALATAMLPDDKVVALPRGYSAGAQGAALLAQMKAGATAEQGVAL